MSRPILPGATLGVLGSGQLGRMLALTARRMGYRIHTLSPETGTPTGQVADREIVAPYDDLAAVRAFARDVDAITVEFENIPVATLEAAALVPVRPGRHVLQVTQHRLREKTFLASAGFPIVPFREVSSLEDLHTALGQLAPPAILKTAAFGYDGKGQVTISAAEEAPAAFSALGGQQAILETRVDLAAELSVVAARGVDGRSIAYDPIHNTHRGGILDLSVAPAALDLRIARQAVEITRALLEVLDVVGVLCAEFFLTTSGALLVNELAPRPHNSGHLTIEACATSQFEQQLRALCGLPLGAPDLRQPAAMANLLGDLWQHGQPNWPAACAVPGVTLHLYGKQDPRPGRKMGHLTAVAVDALTAERRVLAARAALQPAAREEDITQFPG